MKNKKGFTLIELLAVIVILAIIALIAVPVIMNIINKANKSAFKDTVYGVISAGELYFSEQLLDVNGMQEDKTFDFADKNNGLQIKGELPQSGSMIVTKEGKVAIAASNGRYCVTKGFNDTDVTVTEDVENCEMPKITYVNGYMSSENKCIKEGTCTQEEINAGILVNVKVNNSQTYDFYVMADTGTELTLLMSENLGDNVEWYIEGDNSQGPLTALNYLNKLTDEEWSNIPMKEYIYSDDGGGNKYSIEEPYLMRARMITYTEANNIIANNGLTPRWLIINLNGTGDDTTDSNGNYRFGYWTSAAADGFSHLAHNVYCDGDVYYYETNIAHMGIRPVIELSK